MKNLTTLTNVKTLSKNTANKIKGGVAGTVAIDNFSVLTTSNETFKITMK